MTSLLYQLIQSLAIYRQWRIHSAQLETLQLLTATDNEKDLGESGMAKAFIFFLGAQEDILGEDTIPKDAATKKNNLGGTEHEYALTVGKKMDKCLKSVDLESQACYNSNKVWRGRVFANRMKEVLLGLLVNV